MRRWRAKLNPLNYITPDYTQKGEFNSAYESAKRDGLKAFMWQGERYSTEYGGTPVQEALSYGVDGKEISPKDASNRVLVQQFPPLSPVFPPGHIEASSHDNNVSVDYWDKGNYYMGLDRIKPIQRGKAYNVYGADPSKVYDVASSLPPVDEPGTSTWNLITNNCAGQVCDALDVPRAAFDSNRSPLSVVDTPWGTMKKIKAKYATQEITGRTLEDYKIDVRKKSPSDILEDVDKYLGLAVSPEFNKATIYGEGAKELLIKKIQMGLENNGYKLPKSRKSDGNFDGVLGAETKAAIEEYKKKGQVKTKSPATPSRARVIAKRTTQP